MRSLIGAVAACAVTSAWAAAAVMTTAPAARWIDAWYSPPVAPMPSWCCNQVRAFKDQTVRQVVRLEASGSL